jgi:hypothetical protein
MSELQSYRTMIGYASADLEEAVSLIPAEVFGKRPAPGANPASFVYFHVLRHWDRDINVRILGQMPDADAWHREGFTGLTGYDPKGKGASTLGMGTGYGYSDSEVDEVPANKDAFMRYQRVLKAETDRLLDSLDDQSVRGERILPSGAKITTAGRFQHLIAHTYLHIGDIEYIKGLVGAPSCDVPNIG